MSAIVLIPVSRVDVNRAALISVKLIYVWLAPFELSLVCLGLLRCSSVSFHSIQSSVQFSSIQSSSVNYHPGVQLS